MSPKKQKTLLVPMSFPKETENTADKDVNAGADKAEGNEDEEQKDEAAVEENAEPTDSNDAIDPNGLPDAESVKNRASGQGFDKSEVMRMRAIFNRFKVPDTVDVHKDDLQEILSRLGYLMVTEEDVRKIADDVTIYSTLDFNEFCVLAE